MAGKKRGLGRGLDASENWQIQSRNMVLFSQSLLERKIKGTKLLRAKDDGEQL